MDLFRSEEARKVSSRDFDPTPSLWALVLGRYNALATIRQPFVNHSPHLRFQALVAPAPAPP